MKLTLNREYLLRHAGVTVLFVALGGWFGYDAFVGYPATPAAALYEKIEGAPPSGGRDVEAFKRQKITSQKGLMTACLVFAAIVGLRLLMSARFDFAFDEDGFTWNGSRHRHGWSDISEVDRARWEKKGIVRIRVGSDWIALDGWHHVGVGEFSKLLDAHVKTPTKG